LLGKYRFAFLSGLALFSFFKYPNSFAGSLFTCAGFAIVFCFGSSGNTFVNFLRLSFLLVLIKTLLIEIGFLLLPLVPIALFLFHFFIET